MNRVVLCGRLTRDPDVRYSQGESPLCIARYSLAVDRVRSRNRDQNGNAGQQTADFISCIAFGKQGEFVEKYLHKGMKMIVSGRIQTGSYTNKDGVKVYTTDVVVEEHEFCEAKGTAAGTPDARNDNVPAVGQDQKLPTVEDFMNLPDIDEELPFT